MHRAHTLFQEIHPQHWSPAQTMMKQLVEQAREDTSRTLTIVVRDAREIRERHLRETHVAKRLGLQPEQLIVVVIPNGEQRPEESIEWVQIIHAADH